MHYFEDLLDAMGDRQAVELPDAKVEVHRGRATNVLITEEDRIIDLSQAPDGEILDGVEIYKKYLPHDDERDFVWDRRPYVNNEEHARHLGGLAAGVRNQPPDPTSANQAA